MIPKSRLVVALLLGFTLIAAGLAAQARPNILWLTSEDNGPHLGAYGDEYATTPNLDRLAASGMIYRHAWSNAPVCAPARTAIITGMFPQSTGSHHMRSKTRLPPGIKMFPQLLREAGYYTTNNAKEDYNLEKPGQVWDESSREAHWRNRPEGRPFFAIFNFTVSHESQIRRRPHQAVHDPAGVRVPAYHPDTPEVRQDWAQYHDKLTEMDVLVGERLRELEESGLAGDTIVVYFGDHGAGMPRSKRWPYDSGLRVPLIVHFPEKHRHLAGDEYAPGGKTERLVAFVDLAPTMLSLAGIEPPSTMQGRAFLGPYAGPSKRYLHGFRDRMDERYDMVRTVRDERYVYVRNYMPHRVYGQHVEYMFQTPTTRVWKELFDAGRLTPEQQSFWQRKPPEELYDLDADPDEVHNLAGSSEYAPVLERLRGEQRRHLQAIRDLGFLPEAEQHLRSAGTTPYQLGRDPARYPLAEIWRTAELAAGPPREGTAALVTALSDSDSAVRYWAALGLLARGREVVRSAEAALERTLGDSSASVAIVVAEALGRFGSERLLPASVRTLIGYSNLAEHDIYTTVAALNALDYLDQRAIAAREEIAALPREQDGLLRQFRSYVPRLLDKILADLEVDH